MSSDRDDAVERGAFVRGSDSKKAGDPQQARAQGRELRSRRVGVMISLFLGLLQANLLDGDNVLRPLAAIFVHDPKGALPEELQLLIIGLEKVPTALAGI